MNNSYARARKAFTARDPAGYGQLAKLQADLGAEYLTLNIDGTQRIQVRTPGDARFSAGRDSGHSGSYVARRSLSTIRPSNTTRLRWRITTGRRAARRF